MLVVPEPESLSSEVVEVFRDAVEQDGVGLVAIIRTGAIAAEFAELLGASVTGMGHRAGRIGTEAIGGGELVNYLSFSEQHAVSASLGAARSSYPGSFVRVLETTGESLGWIHDADFEAMDGERWFGWYPGEPSSLLGTARTAGAGRVISWAAPVDSLFFRQGRPEFGRALTESCRWVARAEPPVVVQAPLSVEAGWWRHPGGELVGVFANRTTNDLYAIGSGISIGAASSSAGGAAAGASTLRAQHPRAVIPVEIIVEMPGVSQLEGLVANVTGSSIRAATANEGVRPARD